MNTKLLIIGSLAVVVGIALKAGSASGSTDPGQHPEISPEDTAEDILQELENYYNSLKARYSDDPTLANQLNQALNSAALSLEYNGNLNNDPGYQMFVSQLNGYITYRETIGYITFVEYAY